MHGTASLLSVFPEQRCASGQEDEGGKSRHGSFELSCWQWPDAEALLGRLELHRLARRPHNGRRSP